MAGVAFELEYAIETMIRAICTDYNLNYREVYRRYISDRMPKKPHLVRMYESDSMVFKKLRIVSIQNRSTMLSGADFTKDTRRIAMGDVSKGSGTMRPEIYQREQIVKYTGIPCEKTHMRINWKTHQLIEKIHPMKSNDGFNYSENFDGVQITPGGRTIYVNLKNVCGKGGSQMRTLRHQSYHFVDSQLEYLKSSGDTNVFFGNVLDGDEAADCMRFFNNLLEEYGNPKQVYVGDLKGYIDWFYNVVY